MESKKVQLDMEILPINEGQSLIHRMPMAQPYNQLQWQILLRLPDGLACRVQRAIENMLEETANDTPSSSSSSSSTPSLKQGDAASSLEGLAVKPVKYDISFHCRELAIHVHNSTSNDSFIIG